MPESFTYELTRAHRRTVSIQIQPDGRIIVKAPHLMPKPFINQFISEKSDWIRKHLDALHRIQPVHVPSFREGDEYMYLGKTYPLKSGNYKEISVSDKLYVPQFLMFRIKKELKNWYVRQAEKIITDRVNHYARVMNTSYKRIFFSDTSSKWGTCHGDNTLQFNWRLVMAPMLVIDYVVVHELAHTREKNHGAKFWREVGTYKPAYKQYRKWLRDNSHRLHVTI